MVCCRRKSIPKITEEEKLNLDAFNEATGGAIALVNEFTQGDFIEESYFKSMENDLHDLDIYSAIY